jgi:hypothetical protein
LKIEPVKVLPTKYLNKNHPGLSEGGHLVVRSGMGLKGKAVVERSLFDFSFSPGCTFD